jgi:hypothetical protein
VVAFAAAVVVAATGLAGCFDRGDTRSGVGLIDERAGAYRGIGVGASEADVRRAFGPPGDGEGFFPLGESFGEIGGAPSVVVWPRGTHFSRVLRYDEVAFLVGERGVYAFVVTEEDARTRLGVGIGDPQAAARRAYDAGCIEQPYGEPLFGGEPSTFRTCRATVGKRIRIWFGRDPIRSITLARVGRP